MAKQRKASKPSRRTHSDEWHTIDRLKQSCRLALDSSLNVRELLTFLEDPHKDCSIQIYPLPKPTPDPWDRPLCHYNQTYRGIPRKPWWRRALAWVGEYWLVLYLGVLGLWLLGLAAYKLFVE
jgi:hypothetical protein